MKSGKMDKACIGCKGCADLSSMNKCNIFVYPRITIENKILECPCRSCLVKVMCRAECEPFIKYLNLCRESTKVVHKVIKQPDKIYPLPDMDIVLAYLKDDKR